MKYLSKRKAWLANGINFHFPIKAQAWLQLVDATRSPKLTTPLPMTESWSIQTFFKLIKKTKASESKSPPLYPTFEKQDPKKYKTADDVIGNLEVFNYRKWWKFNAVTHMFWNQSVFPLF